MGLFDDMLKYEESLFKDESVFDLNYLPDLLPYRENQQKYIAECIKPLGAGRTGSNLFIHGAPGIGKTSCIKFVFRELKEKTDEIKPVYINCWDKQTTNAVLAELASQIGCIAVNYKNSEELWKKIERTLEGIKGLAVAFDEIDKLTSTDGIYQIIESMKNTALLFITNDFEFLSDMDPRLKSRLNLKDLEFQPYKKSEVEGILKERAEAGFVNNVWRDTAIDLVVEKTYKQGDVRFGLFLLKESGRIAEQNASKAITAEHVSEASKKMADYRSSLSAGLGHREKIVLDAIKENKGIDTGELSDLLKERGHELPDSTLRRITQKLDSEGYIFREESTKDGRGKTMRHFADE